MFIQPKRFLLRSDMPYDYLGKKSVLLIGPPRSEKLLFAEQFLVNGFKNNILGIYIITNDFPESVINKMKSIHGIGNFHVESKLLKIIDCYSTFIGVPKQESNIIKNASGPQALNEISIVLSKMLASNSRIVLDSATTLLLQNPFNMIEKFFQVVIGKIKVHNSTFFILVEEGTHDARDIAVLESLTNATVYFREENDHKFIEIKDMSIHKKIPYEASTNGLVFKELVEA